jgi:hypothetical protein
MLWIAAAGVLLLAVLLMSQSWRRGRPAFLAFGLLLLAVTVLLGTLALLDTT